MLHTWELPILHGVVDYSVPFDVNGQVVVVVTVNRRFLTGLQHVLPDTNVLGLEQDTITHGAHGVVGHIVPPPASIRGVLGTLIMSGALPGQ